MDTLSNRLMLLLLWVVLAMCITAVLSIYDRKGMKHMPWNLKLGFSAFLSLLLTALLSDAA